MKIFSDKMLILIAINVLIVSADCANNPDNSERTLGDTCELRNNQLGICSEISNCETVKKLFDTKQTSEIVRCRFIGKRSIVCCPQEGPLEINRNPKFIKALCINPKKQLKIDDHIISGIKAVVGEFPYQVALGYEGLGNGTEFKCGGSLIAEDIVITAAHCANKKDTIPKMVRLGKTSLNLEDTDDEAPAVDIEIDKIRLHSQYSRKIRHNDIAMIKLKKPVKYTEFIKPICLATKGPTNPMESLTMTGYGTSDINTQTRSDWLLKGIVNEHKFDECKKQLKDVKVDIVDSQFCTHSTKGVDSCQGDSGGPVIYEENDIKYLYGIISYGAGCGSPSPGINTRVDKFLDWIEQEMTALGDYEMEISHNTFMVLIALNLVLIINFVSTSPSPNNDLDYGETCVLNDNVLGTCKEIIQCEYSKQLFRQRKHSEILNYRCKFRGRHPYVCCPSPVSRIDEIPTTEKIVETTRTTEKSTAADFEAAEDDITSIEVEVDQPSLIEASTTTTTEASISEEFFTSPVKDSGLTRYQKALCENETPEIQLGLNIVGGERADIGEFPFHAAIGYREVAEEKPLEENPIRYHCGGSVIAHDVVISAAHCFIGKQYTPEVVKLGRSALNDSDEEDYSDGDDVKIEKVILHPDYSRSTKLNDIALIKLARPFNTTRFPFIKPICLSTNDVNLPANFTVIGYGKNDVNTGSKSDWLLKATVNEVSNADCNEMMQGLTTISETQTCALGYKGADSCQGDSGGPLSFEKSHGGGKLSYLHGIVSYGVSCGSAVPGIYTKVNKYLNWIEKELNLMEQELFREHSFNQFQLKFVNILLSFAMLYSLKFLSVFVFVLIINFTSSSLNHERDLGDACTLDNDKKGICKETQNCEYARELLKQHKYSEIMKHRCKFGGVYPYVCCPELSDSRLNVVNQTDTVQPSIFNVVNQTDTVEPLIPSILKISKFQKALCKDETPYVRIGENIVGGENAGVGEFPYIAAIGYQPKNSTKKDKFDYKCGGSLIAEDIVITAAHCLNKVNIIPKVVKLGRTSLVASEHDYSEGDDIDIEYFKIHPKYSHSSKHNDIALLKLKRPYNTSSKDIKPICLSSNDENLPINFTIAGFGRNDVNTQSTSDWLQKAIVNEYPFTKCQDIIMEASLNTKKITDYSFCAIGYKGADSCQGDSGGPLSYELKFPSETGSLIYLHGVVSTGIGCGSAVPGIYTKVNKYLDWIEKEMDLME
ncbi:ovochymase-like [Chironomus tepperi]|uniref:ovochymase-like n=1 Tax=Chironomus tepperi TaxID=113505 RepID=UPI00391EEC8E